MKKFKFFAFALLSAFLFAACASVDSKLEDLEKACKDGDKEAVKELMEELNEMTKDEAPTKEQEEKILELTEKYPELILGEEVAAAKKAYEAGGAAMEEYQRQAEAAYDAYNDYYEE